MDLGYLLNILLKRKWLLLSVILLASVATWFFIGKLPSAYKSKAVISTGIIDYKGISLQTENPFIQQFQIESSFNSLIEKMKSRTSVKLLTDKLLLHDLQAGNAKELPFRQPDAEELGLSEAEVSNIVMKLKANFNDSVLNAKPQTELPNNRLAEAYGYDYETLLKKLEIKRIGETDYLSAEFESEGPELSFFVVSTFIEEFFKMHEYDLSYKEDKTLEFETKQLAARKADLDSISEKINQYKNTNGLVDVSSQRESMVGHIRELEVKLEEQRLLIPALGRNIESLNREVMKYNKDLGNNLSNNILSSGNIIQLIDEINRLQAQKVEYFAAGKNTDAISKRIEALREQQSKLIDKNIPVGIDKRGKIDDQVIDMMKESMQKQLDLELAEAAKVSYQAEINRLESKAGKLLVDDNQLASLESEKLRIEKEYSDARAKYEAAKLYADGRENPLSVIEKAAYPFEPESKHQAVFAVFAGVASGSIASIVLFLLAFIDSSLQSPSQFQRMTRLPLLGHVNKVKVRSMNLQNLFANTQPQQELEIFKENIRKLRTVIEGSDGKSFLFVSPKEQEGKSFLVVLLAYALSLSDKKILIIDTNFKNNTLSGFKTKSFIEISTDGPQVRGIGTGFSQLTSPHAAGPEDANLKNIDIVANKGGSQSPSEVLAGKNFKNVIEQYSKKYDFIFLEAAAMNKYSDARELLPFVDKLVAVMSAESPIGNADKDTLEFLKLMNGKMLGGILNNVDLKNI
ncbi:MAG: hypothetical protein HY842_18790 [Bacteroidetes bacterium]|nr:hypothetical protein [Bacteroidota bacterium]